MSLHSIDSHRTAVALKPSRASLFPNLGAAIDAAPDSKLCAAVLFIVGVLYVAMYNPFWVPSGDGDLYVAIARSIVQGEGFKFNGQFVNICPPGWPLILAGVMLISPTFTAFKIVTIVSMLVSLGAWFFVLRRVASGRTAAGVVLLTGILVHVYSLTFWTHSEAVYCAISTLSLLLALQIAERKPGAPWRIALLIVLCAAGVFVRWAAFIQPAVLCAALLHESRFWKVESFKRWLVCGAVCLATFATFFAVRRALELTPQQELEQREAGAVFDDVSAAPRASATADAKKVDMVNVAATKDRSVAGELIRRGVESGTWLSWLFWQPFRFAAAVPALAWIGVVVGWIGIFACSAKLIDAFRQRQWLWWGVAAYVAALCINWPNANPRYLVPVAPLLLLAAIQGTKLLFIGSIGAISRDRAILFAVIALAIVVSMFEAIVIKRFEATMVAWTLVAIWAMRYWSRSGGGDRPARVARVMVGAFVASIVLVNGGLFAIDVRVARSSDFYNRYEAGFNDDLVKACYQLQQLGLQDAELAVSERYVNLGRARKSKYAVRAAVLLTGKSVQTIRDKWAGEPKAELLRWAQRRKVQYYLDQRPNVPWRLWHFVLPRELNQKLVKGPLGDDSGGWTLYKINIAACPVLPPSQPTNFIQETVGANLRIDWPTAPLATAPATEYRRTVEKVALPQLKNWPSRVPGM